MTAIINFNSCQHKVLLFEGMLSTTIVALLSCFSSSANANSCTSSQCVCIKYSQWNSHWPYSSFYSRQRHLESADVQGNTNFFLATAPAFAAAPVITDELRERIERNRLRAIPLQMAMRTAQLVGRGAHPFVSSKHCRNALPRSNLHLHLTDLLGYITTVSGIDGSLSLALCNWTTTEQK